MAMSGQSLKYDKPMFCLLLLKVYLERLLYEQAQLSQRSKKLRLVEFGSGLVSVFGLVLVWLLFWL